MQKDKIKITFQFTLVFFLLLAFIFLLNFLGVFNILYKNRLELMSRTYLQKYDHFIQSRIAVMQTVAQDGIISSSLIQSSFNNNLMDSLQHLNLYKKNFPDIRNITLFNSLYNIVLTTELENEIVNKNLSKDWFLQSLSRHFFVSDFNYHSKYNEFILTIILPMGNVVNENIGFLMIDFSLEDLLKSLSEEKGVIFLLQKEGRITFASPVTGKRISDQDLNRFPLLVKIKHDDQTTVILAGTKKFMDLPLFFKILLILFFVLLLLFSFYFYAEKNIFTRTRHLKQITDEIVNFSKKITVNELERIESSQKRKQEELVGKKADKTEEKDKDFILIE